MARYEERIEIAAAPEQVWAVMSDVERWPTWTPTMTSAERLDDGAFGPGARFRVRQPRLPQAVWTVDQVEPGRAFSWTSASPGVHSWGDHRVEPAGEHSLAVLVFEQTGPLSGLASLIASRLVRRYVRTEAQSIKRFVEQQARQDAR